jgi:maleylacetoacetate isomerase
LPTGEIIV